uniref:Uncharacterized protein n=1 Tax=Chromera velia CCMP2878 TaxID=1169474 RepID=A0A0K6S6U1_9ALVE|eukprot:Cvel_3420.t1-p1 / transcript=Cvel_3420.t1 / gene=Cvel_3420 / organism=Chromera_velia_CCMP2878 / gene_product=hypothetical protein / transcript_product=hypothetical protein / location=Cvel_scaffold137:86481-90910(-) / protein_length=292 / sequence_SO=supercontig / SO=protein_coding / is_pseudo=false
MHGCTERRWTNSTERSALPPDWYEEFSGETLSSTQTTHCQLEHELRQMDKPGTSTLHLFNSFCPAPSSKSAELQTTQEPAPIPPLLSSSSSSSSSSDAHASHREGQRAPIRKQRNDETGTGEKTKKKSKQKTTENDGSLSGGSSMNSQDGGGDGRRPIALSFAAARQGSGDVVQQPSADTGPSPFGKDVDRDMKPSLGLHHGGGSKEGNNGNYPSFAASNTLNLTQEMDQLRAPPPFPPEEESGGPAVSSSQGQQQQVNSRPTISFETLGGDGRAGEGESSAEKGVGRRGFG